MKSSAQTLGLSDRDKTAKPFGFNSHHTHPHRHVPCILGNMLAPLSADDIPPISPEAMASVQAALKLLANLVADRDINLFLAYSDDAKLEEHRAEARAILRARGGGWNSTLRQSREARVGI